MLWHSRLAWNWLKWHQGNHLEVLEFIDKRLNTRSEKNGRIWTKQQQISIVSYVRVASQYSEDKNIVVVIIASYFEHLWSTGFGMIEHIGFFVKFVNSFGDEMQEKPSHSLPTWEDISKLFRIKFSNGRSVL